MTFARWISVCLLLIAGCGKTEAPPLVIAELAPRSGPRQAVGDQAVAGTRLAVQEVNAGEKLLGRQVLVDGGNAIDAIVAAALTAAVAAPHQTGIGGYGAHMVLAIDQGRRIVSIDGNTAAPIAMKADTFQPDAKGQVPGRINEFGWRAAGVPGILAGLQLARSGGSLGLSWTASCSGQATGYAVYEGTLSALRGGYSDLAPVTCAAGSDLTETFVPGAGDRYYLVAPTVPGAEGYLGNSSFGSPRPAAADACAPREAPSCP